MGWGAAVVAIVVAAIGFGGGYFSARWQARSDLAQWRRDRLLQFCSDLLAAGGELVDRGWEIGEGQDVPYPTETMRKLAHAMACISLLSRELRKPANSCALAYAEVLRQAYAHANDPAKPSPDFDAASTAAGEFATDVNHVLLDVSKSPTLWSPVWLRIRTYVQEAMAGRRLPTL